MEKKFVGSNKSVEKPTDLVALLTATETLEGFPALTRLAQDPSLGDEPFMLLDPDELEMLEAELQNQGILSAPGDQTFRLSFRLSCECSAFRWRARCYGAQRIALSFKVNLTRFILHCAKRASVAELTPGGPDVRELIYLEQFAAYLVSQKPRAKNKYMQGMSLVLSVLAKPKKPRRTNNKKEIDVVLPATKFEFLQMIAPYRTRRTPERFTHRQT